VLRRIFGLKRDEVTGGSRKVHNEELHNFYCSPSIIRFIRLRRMRCAGHVARTEVKHDCIYDIGGKARRKETTRKTNT
jgi:hypothetical protein